MFCGEQDGAAPFAAEGESLDDPQQCQQDRGEDADTREIGEEADRAGCDTHDADRPEKCAFAADPVTEVPEEDGPERADQVGHRKEEEGQDGAGRAVLLGEEERRAEDRAEVGEDVEVVRFEGRADERGPDDFSGHLRFGGFDDYGLKVCRGHERLSGGREEGNC